MNKDSRSGGGCERKYLESWSWLRTSICVMLKLSCCWEIHKYKGMYLQIPKLAKRTRLDLAAAPRVHTWDRSSTRIMIMMTICLCRGRHLRQMTNNVGHRPASQRLTLSSCTQKSPIAILRGEMRSHSLWPSLLPSLAISRVLSRDPKSEWAQEMSILKATKGFDITQFPSTFILSKQI